MIASLHAIDKLTFGLPLLVAAMFALMFLLSGCNSGPDQFVLACEDQGGTILSDSKTSTDTVIVPNAGGSPGVGVSSSTTTIDLCIVDGDVVDMRVR